MKCIMVMFDSLNRHHLPNYGCDWTDAPNFRRLGEKTATFDHSYVCSMPCMPARRDLQTGRPNFLHRSWGPMEPFDDSVPEMLKRNGTYSHLATDHYHYFEEGGCNYHNRFQTWEFFRGQEGDPWIGQLGEPTLMPDSVHPPERYKPGRWDKFRQDMINREHASGPDHYQIQTFNAGLDFIDRNKAHDNWFLQIETFDPHEPFHSNPEFKEHYRKLFEDEHGEYKGPHFDWPPYRKIEETRDVIDHCRYEYAALLSMCDAQLGRVLDAMDEHNMWDDTMLIVCTDHGFLFGEHECWAKCWMPFYEEIAHTPFFVWDPRSPHAAGQRRESLVQPSIDIPVTLLGYFGLEPTAAMTGKDLAGVVADDTPVREAAIFGMHGGQVNVTDGQYVYMRGPANETNSPLNEYTLMPTHMVVPFAVDELKEFEPAGPFGWTNTAKVMKLPNQRPPLGGLKAGKADTLLWDVKADPQQQRPLSDAAIEDKMVSHMVNLMQEVEAPAEQYQRLGVAAPVAS